MSGDIVLRKDSKSGRIVAEFPFSETKPSLFGDHYQVYQRFKTQLSILSKQQRNVILMNMCAEFGKEKL